MSIRKILLAFLPIFLILIFVSNGSLLAQDNSLNSLINAGKVISCLAADKTGDLAEKDPEYGGETYPVILTGDCLSQTGCDLVICNSNNKEIEEDEKFIADCEGESTPECSPEKIKSWEDKIDAETPQDDLQPGCVATGEKLPFGSVNITWEDLIHRHIEYTYYAIGENNPIGTGQGGGVDGQDLSQQLAQINSFTFTQEGLEQKCVSIIWDPFGRVFDSQSLEPIPDIDVTLIDDKTGRPAIQQFESNHDVTFLNGLFNILVEKEGLYQIQVDVPATHEFVANPVLNPKYSLIYSDLYFPKTSYLEKQGIATHHDIALQPKGEPYSAPAQVLSIDSAVAMNGGILYKGKVTHPLAKVCLQVEETHVQIRCVNADKAGAFIIFVDKKYIPPERLIPVVTKIDFLGRDTITIRTNSSDQKLGYEPVLSYVEGYARDNQGKIAYGAKINIRLKMNDKIFYTTYADEDGFFTIYAKDLPLFEYYLEIIPAQSTNPIRQTTSQFIKINEEYIKSNNLNLVASTKDDQSIINPTTGQLNSQPSFEDSEIPTAKDVVSSPSKSSLFNPTAIIISIIIFFLVGATVSLILYIKRSSKS